MGKILTQPYISHPARAGQHTPGLALAFVLVISTLIGIIGLLSGTYCLTSRLSSLTLYLSPLTSHYLQVDRRQRVPRWDLPAGAQVPDQDREVTGGSARTGGLQQTRHSRQSPLQAQSQLSSHPGPGQAPDHHPLQPGGRAETLPGPLPGAVEGREG